MIQCLNEDSMVPSIQKHKNIFLQFSVQMIVPRFYVSFAKIFIALTFLGFSPASRKFWIRPWSLGSVLEEEDRAEVELRMGIFEPFRAIGYITTNVPFSVQRLGTETFVTVSVGKAFQIYNVLFILVFLTLPLVYCITYLI